MRPLLLQLRAARPFQLGVLCALAHHANGQLAAGEWIGIACSLIGGVVITGLAVAVTITLVVWYCNPCIRRPADGKWTALSPEAHNTSADPQRSDHHHPPPDRGLSSARSTTALISGSYSSDNLRSTQQLYASRCTLQSCDGHTQAAGWGSQRHVESPRPAGSIASVDGGPEVPAANWLLVRPRSMDVLVDVEEQVTANKRAQSVMNISSKGLSQREYFHGDVSASLTGLAGTYYRSQGCLLTVQEDSRQDSYASLGQSWPCLLAADNRSVSSEAFPSSLGERSISDEQSSQVSSEASDSLEPTAEFHESPAMLPMSIPELPLPPEEIPVSSEETPILPFNFSALPEELFVSHPEPSEEVCVTAVHPPGQSEQLPSEQPIPVAEDHFASVREIPPGAAECEPVTGPRPLTPAVPVEPPKSVTLLEQLATGPSNQPIKITVSFTVIGEDARRVGRARPTPPGSSERDPAPYELLPAHEEVPDRAGHPGGRVQAIKASLFSSVRDYETPDLPVPVSRFAVSDSGSADTSEQDMLSASLPLLDLADSETDLLMSLSNKAAPVVPETTSDVPDSLATPTSATSPAKSAPGRVYSGQETFLEAPSPVADSYAEVAMEMQTTLLDYRDQDSDDEDATPSDSSDDDFITGTLLSGLDASFLPLSPVLLSPLKPFPQGFSPPGALRRGPVYLPNQLPPEAAHAQRKLWTMRMSIIAEEEEL